MVHNKIILNHDDVKIGLIGYARPSFGATSSYVKIFSDITNDYDKISASINSIKINIEKGDQFIPNVLYTASLGLHWSDDLHTRKIIFLIGNGTVQTGKFDIGKACEIAQQNKIIIQPVYCKQYNGGETDIAGWKGIARMNNVELADIKISQVERTYSISGVNADLIELNKKLASTFVFFGNDGTQKFKTMNVVDTFCMRVSPQCFYARCNVKLSNGYLSTLATWDLTALIKQRNPDFETLDRKQLPKQFQNSDSKTLAKMLLEKKEERNYLITQMRNSLSRIKFSSAYTCSLDSIINSFD